MGGVLADWEIRKEIKITPFCDERLATVQNSNITSSFGLSSYGYDIRLGRKFKIFTNSKCAVIDPKNFNPDSFINIEADFCLIPPNSFVLAESMEYMEIPRDVLALCVGKSTIARYGILVAFTCAEPAWKGVLTLEISNTTPLPAKVYSGEGIAQIVFLRADSVCEVSYEDKKGKYQNQEGITLPRTK